MTSPKVRLHVPAWAAAFYMAASLALVPWTIYLNNTLRTRHVFRHWDVAWIGLDVGLIACLLLTGVTAYRKSIYTVMAATLTGGILIVDAWFDVLGARPGAELTQAVLAAAVLELPLAIASFRLAYVTLTKAFRR